MQGNLAVWKKKEGDEIAAGDVLCEVETDKARDLIPSPVLCHKRDQVEPWCACSSVTCITEHTEAPLC